MTCHRLKYSTKSLNVGSYGKQNEVATKARNYCHVSILSFLVLCRYKDKTPDKRPSSLAQSLKECDKALFPNIHVLLQIGCTIPATSCESERSASTMRRLNNYLRSSMHQSRLSNLAVLHSHYDRASSINVEEAITIYARKHTRRLELSTLL